MKNKCPEQLAIYKKLRNKATHEKGAAERAYFDKLIMLVIQQKHGISSISYYTKVNPKVKCRGK